jgi:hypothetical protein
MLFSGSIENFFKRPSEPASSEGDCVLYHLRVDLEKLYGAESSFDLDPSNHAFLATMGLLSGLDYLAQAYLGRPSTGNRFVQLLIDLAAMDVDSAEALYQLRCGLVHSVSLSAVSKRKYRSNVTYSFTLTDDRRGAIVHKQYERDKEVGYQVSFWGLKSCFTGVIDKIKAICEDIEGMGAQVVRNNVCQLASEKILKKY